MHWVVRVTGNQKLSKVCIILCVYVLDCLWDRKNKNKKTAVQDLHVIDVWVTWQRKSEALQSLHVAVCSCVGLFTWQGRNQKLFKLCMALCVLALGCPHDREETRCAVYSCIGLFTWQRGSQRSSSPVQYCCVFLYWVVLMTGNQNLSKSCMVLLYIHVLNCSHDRKPKAVQALCSTAVYSCIKLFSWQETKSCPNPV